jgi:hypothetical protein
MRQANVVMSIAGMACLGIEQYQNAAADDSQAIFFVLLLSGSRLRPLECNRLLFRTWRRGWKPVTCCYRPDTTGPFANMCNRRVPIGGDTGVCESNKRLAARKSHAADGQILAV